MRGFNFVVCALLAVPGISGAQSTPRSLSPAIEAELDRFVLEPGKSPATELQGGVLHVRQHGGSTRTRRIVSDFTLTAEVNLSAASTDLQIGIRTINTDREWPQRGYWLRLSGARPAAVEARDYDLKPTANALLRTAPGSWHAVTIKAIGPAIDVTSR
jgi:hypothetical protein